MNATSKGEPLVSIIIPNYNHSRFLDQCIQSALNQTYRNIEIIVSDNCSTDDSVKTVKKYLPRGIRLNKNPENVLASNYDLLYEQCTGEYFILLCADDALQPDFIRQAVEIMEHHPNISLVHGERDYIDEDNNLTELDPFFDRSFCSEGRQMLPIFMLTDVGQSSQGLIRKKTFEQVGRHNTEHNHLNIDREQWFRLCINGDYAYIRRKSALIRVPNQTSETGRTLSIFYHPIAIYATIKGFVEWGRIYHYDNVIEREGRAMEKLAKDCMGIIKSLIHNGQMGVAKQYLLFIKLTAPGLTETEEFESCWESCQAGRETKALGLDFKNTNNYAYRRRSYAPPEVYEGLEGFENV